MLRDINIKYGCGCAKIVRGKQSDWEQAAFEGFVRIDRKFSKIGEYLETVYFDFSKCNECKGRVTT